mgnify:CR=1 FL=1
MRFLLISDTHGRLGVIDELTDRVRADAVIHAGDFGFFDEGSFERLSDRELRLHVAHSDLPRTERDRILALSRKDMIRTAREHRLLGAFQFFLEGIESFHVPVYAVWGNHEDKEVVERLFHGDVAVTNLHILHHRRGYRVGPAFISGLGGNVLPGSKMMQRPIAGGGGKIWSALSQFSDLIQTVERDAAPAMVRIFVSHVSPGKEPFVELIGARTRADFTVSGHMGAPASMVWNAFAVSTVEQAEKRLRDGFDAVRIVSGHRQNGCFMGCRDTRIHRPGSGRYHRPWKGRQSAPLVSADDAYQPARRSCGLRRPRYRRDRLEAPDLPQINTGSVVSGTRETVSSPTWLRVDCSRASMAQRTASMTWSLPFE